MSTKWQNKIILITGAGSGIGRALANLFASKHAKLVLTDIVEEGLAETIKAIESQVVLAKCADVSSVDDWRSLAKEIEKSVGHLDGLINNAGISPFDYFDEMSQDIFDKVMDINLNGVVHGCREMIPLLEKSERGMIVNIASVFGLITMPAMTPYHASKFAVRGFTEALSQDFKFQNKNIDVICVMPGGIKTNIANGAETGESRKKKFAAQFEKSALTTPEKAASIIENGMRKNKFRVLIGPDAKFIDLLTRLLPRNYYRVFNTLSGVKKIL